MDADQRERIRQLCEEMAQIIPRDGAVIKMLVEGGGPDESRMVGNEQGYLSLGLELTRGVVEAELMSSDKPCSLNVEWGYLEDDSSDIYFHRFDLDPRLPLEAMHIKRTRLQVAKDVGALVVGTLIALLAAAALVIGFVAIVKWLGHLLSSL